MNCLNCEKYLKEAIDSVYDQTYKNWEIIFWDNASADSSAEIARNYDGRLRYFRGEKTVSLGAARNKALEQTMGEFIAFLDCDDIWMPEKLEKQIPLFNDPEVGLVFCDTIFFNEKGGSKRYYSHRSYWTGWCFSELFTDYFLSMETVVIRRAVLDSEDYWFDIRFNMIEEADLFRRIAYKWKLSMVNEPLSKWRVHSSSWTWTRGHILYEETLQMLANYHEIFPEFSSRFAQEISTLKRQIIISNALSIWRSGNSNGARKFLAPFLFSNIKIFVVFFMTLFPAKILNPLVNRFRKNIIPD